jgi:hypothetical protein
MDPPLPARAVRQRSYRRSHIPRSLRRSSIGCSTAHGHDACTTVECRNANPYPIVVRVTTAIRPPRDPDVNESMRCPLCDGALRLLSPSRRDLVGCRACELFWIPVVCNRGSESNAAIPKAGLGWRDCPVCAKRSLRPTEDQSGPHWQCVYCAGRAYVGVESEPQRAAPSTRDDRFMEWVMAVVVLIGEVL